MKLWLRWLGLLHEVVAEVVRAPRSDGGDDGSGWGAGGVDVDDFVPFRRRRFRYDFVPTAASGAPAGPAPASSSAAT